MNCCICYVCQGIIDKIQSNLDLYSNYWCENKKCIIDKIYYENKVQADYITLKGKHYQVMIDIQNAIC